MIRYRVWGTLLQLGILATISVVSQYSMPRFDDTNWDIALFLTPIGMLKNALSSNATLRSFYFDISAGQTAVSGPQAFLLVIVILSAIVNGLFLLKHFGKDG